MFILMLVCEILMKLFTYRWKWSIIDTMHLRLLKSGSFPKSIMLPDGFQVNTLWCEQYLNFQPLWFCASLFCVTVFSCIFLIGNVSNRHFLSFSFEFYLLYLKYNFQIITCEVNIELSHDLHDICPYRPCLKFPGVHLTTENFLSVQ